MKRTAAFLALMVVCGLSATGSNAGETTEQRATKMLLDTCPRLSALQNTSDILSMDTKRQPAVITDELAMGWREIVQVEVKLASPVTALPRDFYASGQVCRYDIGHGGVVTAKTPCKKICGFDLSSKGAAYLPLEATRSLHLAAD